jgi:phage N-6-adenine-methyltransferase
MEENKENKAETNKLGYVGRTPGTERDSNSWFTPEKYLTSARKALGGKITLDPFSSLEANKVVKAQKFFTEEDNAFTKKWSGKGNRTVWMNPPYSGKLCSEAVTKFIDEYLLESFTEGIFLVNNSTETKWFQRALGSANAVCFTGHRISFWNADGKALSGNTRGQAFFYFGKNTDLFLKTFKEHGVTIKLK